MTMTMAHASQATQKRWLTASTGKLSKVPDLPSTLRQDAAWDLLSPATQQRLYQLLPPGTHNPDIHPLKTTFKHNIAMEIRAWQEDLKDGKETKKWREEALQAGRDRELGMWDEWKERVREENWGSRGDENRPEEIKEDAPEIGEIEEGKDVAMG